MLATYGSYFPVLSVWVCLACSSDPAAAPVGTACTPGDSKACVGPSGCRGGQLCSADGTRYEACDCGGQPRDEAGANSGGSGGNDVAHGGGAGQVDTGGGPNGGGGGAAGTPVTLPDASADAEAGAGADTSAAKDASADARPETGNLDDASSQTDQTTCAAFTELCRVGHPCCSGLSCFAPDLGGGMPAGDSYCCVPDTLDCSSDEECCNGNCLLDPGTGHKHCHSPGADGASCVPTGSGCQSHSQCCSTRCLPPEGKVDALCCLVGGDL